MTRAASRLRIGLSAAPLLLLLGACGSDALPTTAPATNATAQSAPPLATPGGSCAPAPANAGSASSADSFSDAVCLLTTSDGLRYGDIVAGTGATPQRGQNITVQYTGWLANGTQFDSSRGTGRTPFNFVIGATPPNVIAGWDEGVLSMKVGGKRRLVIPPSLGYGSSANGAIPANSTLIFEVELLSVGGPSPT
jgi:peptidylprolyl isomerase